MIGIDKTFEHPNEVFVHAEKLRSMGMVPIYIICGKRGPTGKTWLTNKLKECGHNAIEISEGINFFVDYHDDKNHMLEMRFNQFIVVLNKPLGAIRKL